MGENKGLLKTSGKSFWRRWKSSKILKSQQNMVNGFAFIQDRSDIYKNEDGDFV